MAETNDLPMNEEVTGEDAPSSGSVSREQIAREVARRRTFGIISHPDAGKTTLTEKLLLFSGALTRTMAGR